MNDQVTSLFHDPESPPVDGSGDEPGDVSHPAPTVEPPSESPRR